MGSKRTRLLLAAAFGALGAAGAAHAEDSDKYFEIYGFVQADYTQDFRRVDPDWEDSLRPSKIPTQEGQFGSNGQSIISVRQTRFGVRAVQPIGGNDLTVRFEFDLYGTGNDAGKTHMRPRHFYGEWGPILAGQTNTTFMDIDVFPNTVEYWGPPGMAFIRNPMIRYTYKKGGNEFAIALEKPANDIDPGNIRQVDPNLGANIKGDEKLPDLTAHWRYDGTWGHFQLAGILRRVGYETIGTVDNKPKGHQTGWGVAATSNIKTWHKDVLHLSALYGQGIANYMNDGGTDLGPEIVAPPATPGALPTLKAKAVPLFGLLIYYDHYWNDHWSSSLGYSQTKIDNTSFQEASAFRNGHYASGNLLWSPDSHILMGVEGIWGQRDDHDNATGYDYRLQFTFKYNFTSRDFFR